MDPINANNNQVLPPHTVRIKRKRGQDPIVALLIDEQTRAGSRQKRSRTDSYVFKLAGTFDSEPAAPGDILLHQENTTSIEETIDKPVFRLTKRTKTDKFTQDDDPEISESLTEMVQSYLGLEENQPTSPVRTTAGLSGATLDSTLIPGEEQADDYVYDIYYRERYTDEDSLDEKKIGVIVLLDSDVEQLGGDEDDDSNGLRTDDEDSNAEDFYKNDYPEEQEEITSSEDEGDNNGFINRNMPISSSKFQMKKPISSNIWVNRDIEGDEEPHEYDGDEEDDEDYDIDIDEDDEEDDDYDVHSPKDEIGEDQWSEDENLEQYRDRVLGDLETKLRE